MNYGKNLKLNNFLVRDNLIFAIISVFCLFHESGASCIHCFFILQRKYAWAFQVQRIYATSIPKFERKIQYR